MAPKEPRIGWGEPSVVGLHMIPLALSLAYGTVEMGAAAVAVDASDTTDATVLEAARLLAGAAIAYLERRTEKSKEMRDLLMAVEIVVRR